MIRDSIQNARTYFKISPRLQAGFEFLLRPDIATVPLGKHELQGDKLFALVQEYQTKRPDETFWETHRKYIDIQCVQKGVEAMNWSPIQHMTMKKDYDAEKDIIVWEGAGQTIHVPAGHFTVFFPHDAHMGGLLIDQPMPVRKIVMKVATE